MRKKRIIIYPYLKTEELPYRIYRLNILIEYFKKNDYIFIVPIEKGADVVKGSDPMSIYKIWRNNCGF